MAFLITRRNSPWLAASNPSRGYPLFGKLVPGQDILSLAHDEPRWSLYLQSYDSNLAAIKCQLPGSKHPLLHLSSVLLQFESRTLSQTASHYPPHQASYNDLIISSSKMPPTKQWIFNAHPDGLPTHEGSNPTFKLTDTTTPELQEGQALVKNIFLSNDPAQRAWLNKYEDESRLYTTPGHPGELMSAWAISEVLETRGADLKVKQGDLVLVQSGWAQYDVVSAAHLTPLPPAPRGLSASHYLGALGATGLTAWHGLVDVVGATGDDVVVVSGAAGATGSMAVQIAKKMLGCKRVVGIAGGEAKCRWVVEGLGADACVDYKAPGWRERLAHEAGAKSSGSGHPMPTVYFDNVGGEILDVMLTLLARNGRIAACGAISSYNDAGGDEGAGAGPKRNWFNVIVMRFRIEGFIVLDFLPKFPESREKLRRAVEEGVVKIDEGEQVVETRFEDIPKTWLKLFDGGNTGKLVTQLV